MVRRRSTTPKTVMIRDRQFWSWAKISLPRDQRDDVVSRLMDRLYAEGLLSVDLRPARAQAQIDETIARQIELMPAAFRALHARRGAEMRRRFRLIVTARKRYYLAAKRGSSRRGSAAPRGGHTSGSGAHQATQGQQLQQQQQQQQQQQEEEEEEEEEEQEPQQQEDDPMEEVQHDASSSHRRSVPWDSDSSSEENTLPRVPTSPILNSSTPEDLEEPGQMDLDAPAPAPAPQTPHRVAEEDEIQLVSPTYETPRSPVDSTSSKASPASPPLVSPPSDQRPAGHTMITDEIESTQPEDQGAEMQPSQSRAQAPEPEMPRREGDEESDVPTETYSTPEDAMRKDLHPDENYDDISSEDTSGSGRAPEVSRIEETPGEASPSTREHSEKPGEDSSDEENSDEEKSNEENSDEHPDEGHPGEGHPGEGQQSQKTGASEPPEDYLVDYDSDDYAAEAQRHPVTPQSQGQDGQGQLPPEHYSQEQFTQYRHSGYVSSPSDSPTEKAPSSAEASQNEGQPASLEHYDPGTFVRDDTIFVYASETSIEEATEFYVHQLVTPILNPTLNDRVPIDNIRFDLFQEFLSPLSYSPNRHEIYYYNVTMNGREAVIVDSSGGIVSGLLMMQLHNSPIEFFLREKSLSAQ